MGLTDSPAGEPGPDLEDPAPIEWNDINRAQQRAAARPFVRPRKTFKLLFPDDPDLAGLEVRARSVSLGKFLQLVKLASAFEGNAADLDGDDIAKLAGLFEGFANELVSWNLCEPAIDGGDPVPYPTTYEAVMAQDVDLMLKIIAGWLAAIGDVAAPLGGTSNGGAPALEGSIPMATPSENPPS